MSVDLADRYGKKRRPSRLQVGALVVVCAALLGWLVWAALPYFSPTVSSQEIGWKVVDQHTVEVRARVDVADDAEGVSCRVKALAADKSVVGEERFTPTDGTNTVTVTTEREATAVEWVGCTAEGQSRPQ